MIRRPPRSTLFPYTRSSDLNRYATYRILIKHNRRVAGCEGACTDTVGIVNWRGDSCLAHCAPRPARSGEHTPELQPHANIVIRLLLEKKKHVSYAHLPDTEA